MRNVSLIFLSFVFIAPGISICSGSPQSLSNWPVWSADGKGWGTHTFAFKEQKDVLDNYRENVLLIHSDLKWKIEHGVPFTLNPKVAPVGRWHDFHVYDLFEEDHGLKQIILETQSHSFRILYSQYDIPGDPKLPASYFVTVNGVQILVSSYHLGAANYLERHFVYDEKNRIPIELDVDTVVQTVIKTIIPEGYHSRLNGKFDAQNLSVKAPVSKPSDAFCCPTGGSIEIRFALRDNVLVTIFKKYMPAPDRH
jgi:hypothetical protein